MKRNMLQKDLWSHSPHDLLSASYDGKTGKDMSSLTFDDTKISSYCFKSSNNSEVCTDDLNFFNSCEDKESSDLLYNDWPDDVGNFEEVGKMLRSCNSSFGLGVTGNNDEMDWFTQEDSTVGCEQVLTMDFKFPCSEPNIAFINISQNHRTPESDDNRSSYEFEKKDEIKLKDQGVKSKGVLQLTNGSGAHFKKDNRMHQKRNLELNSSCYNTYLHPRQMGMFLQSSECDLISKELKNQSENVLEGFWHGTSAEIGLLNVAESSSFSSGSDDISLEATILHHLQQVMEHLDLKTKLCIKDSLYRLATSAEQRHNREGLSSGTAYYSDIGRPLLTAGINKCTGFLDIESTTNPIDRSLAHLLFHTPLDSSTLPSSSPLKPNPKIDAWICHKSASSK